MPDVHTDYDVLTGLAIQAAVIGDKVRSETNLAANLAGLIVTISGIGKSAATQIGLDLLEELVNRRVVAETPLIATHATVEGLLEALQRKRTGIIDLDEFAAFLKDCGRDHMASARENFCRALDGRNIRYMRARSKNVIVDHPSPSVLGTVNIEALRRVASFEDLVGGLFSRFLIVAPDFSFRLPQLRPANESLRTDLVNRLATLSQIDPVKVPLSAEAEVDLRNYAYKVAPFEENQEINLLEVDDHVSAAWVRYGTHAFKVAMLLTAGVKHPPLHIAVTSEIMKQAIEIVERFRIYADRIFGVLAIAEDTRLRTRVIKQMSQHQRLSFSDPHKKIGGKTPAAELEKAVEALIQNAFVSRGDNPRDLVWIGNRN